MASRSSADHCRLHEVSKTNVHYLEEIRAGLDKRPTLDISAHQMVLDPLDHQRSRSPSRSRPGTVGGLT